MKKDPLRKFRVDDQVGIVDLEARLEQIASEYREVLHIFFHPSKDDATMDCFHIVSKKKGS